MDRECESKMITRLLLAPSLSSAYCKGPRLESPAQSSRCKCHWPVLLGRHRQPCWLARPIISPFVIIIAIIAATSSNPLPCLHFHRLSPLWLPASRHSRLPLELATSNQRVWLVEPFSLPGQTRDTHKEQKQQQQQHKCENDAEQYELNSVPTLSLSRRKLFLSGSLCVVVLDQTISTAHTTRFRLRKVDLGLDAERERENCLEQGRREGNWRK